MRQQRVGQQVDRVTQRPAARGVGDERDQGTVHLLDHVVDHEVLLYQPLDHRLQPWVGPTQGRQQAVVLDGVVGGHQPAVGLAVCAQGPVVLPHRHRVDV